ncbi:MAG: RNA 2',3'-cyclic 3'-phosphodiesterase [Desulfobacteraceae bacterium Eth-SRB2]|nr:MAG: RNA 2',3'-cyclic 3'-phosphodiesterase [Desulfobacteraceae bacterium Eth-SRB2]
MSNTIRTFIAIELPEKIIYTIGKVQEKIKSYGLKIRWVRSENIHLTLKFLGDIKKADTEKVAKAISESVTGYHSISLSVKGIGVFPSIKRPRVLWLGISKQLDLLTELQKTLDKTLETMGFPKEKRPFKGHLTLGRIKDKIDPKRLHDVLKEFTKFESEHFFADRIILFESELKPKGAVYTKLSEAHLMVSTL